VRSLTSDSPGISHKIIFFTFAALAEALTLRPNFCYITSQHGSASPSACLAIMRTSFFFFSLLCALPVLCDEYHIHSQDPGCYIYSDGTEKPGDFVKTVGKVAEGYPPYTVCGISLYLKMLVNAWHSTQVVTIDAPISATECTTGPISCNGGKLFIGLDEVSFLPLSSCDISLYAFISFFRAATNSYGRPSPAIGHSLRSTGSMCK
jgi:hypothetical protein